ncbi:AMP-binding protein [Brachybacterium sp. AOP43-C2-M15]|uniref:AMP-binding protein n=1 Tax=Brachybacterium sp. AOP43-C2-M15 TaxID=3457661 RepID=UPI0040338F54
MRLLQASTALRARVALHPRALALVDRRGELTAGELLDLVQLHRRRRRGTAAPAGLGALPPSAPLRQVLVTALAGDGSLELRSSGSTGTPRPQRRGPLSPAQLVTLTDLARRIGLRPGRCIASAAPGVHGHGLLVALGALALGAPVVDLSHLPAAERAALLHRTAPDVLTGVPVHLADLLHADRELGRGRPLLVPRVVSGSDVLSPALRADLARHFRARVHDVYGTTETGSLAVDGRPLRGVRLREADGVLHARTPFTAGRELATDRGRITQHGLVEVLGRADGMLSSGGMLHDPSAVVHVLRSQAAVASARLRIVPDERFGARTIAEVHLEAVDTDRNGTGSGAGSGGVPPSAAELRALVHDRLGAASVPREVRFVDGDGREVGPDGPRDRLSSPGR